MKIGYDGKRAVNNMTGLGNYSRLVLEEIAMANPEDELLVYVPELRSNARTSRIENSANIQFRKPQHRFGGSLWRTFGITENLRKDGIDLYHGLSNELPLNIRKAGVPSVVTLHDVIWRRLPECYNPLDRKIYDYKYGRSCRNADRVVAVSECTGRDAVEFFGISPDKIEVIYQGCDPQFRGDIWDAGRNAELRSRLGLPSRYILQVGTVEKRKNLELTVRGLAALPEDVSLVVVGRDRGGYRRYVENIASEAGVARRILWLDRVEFKDLPGLYQNADAVAYPSHYEGFGIPILEALESMTPVVAATGSCLEEAGGPETIYVSPTDGQAMGEALSAVLNDRELACRMSKAGKRYASRFDNARMADDLHRLYETMLESKNVRN